MTDEEREDETGEENETGEDQDAHGEREAEAGPPEDIENDPAYDPDDPNLKGIKGG